MASTNTVRRLEFIAHPDKSVLQVATLQVISELLLHILEQEPIFRSKLR